MFGHIGRMEKKRILNVLQWRNQWREVRERALSLGFAQAGRSIKMSGPWGEQPRAPKSLKAYIFLKESWSLTKF